MATRVVQWGSGNVGRQALAAVLARDDMELVGLYVTNSAKAGLDAGELAGASPIGVRATNSIDEIVALDADVVLHMPLPSLVYGVDPGADVANFVRLLSSGKNVVTTVGYMYPKVYGEELMGSLAAACAAGNTAFHGTGYNPGWFGDLLPLLMTGLSLHVETIDIQEITNFQFYPSPEIMFDMMKFGKIPEDLGDTTSRYRQWLDGLFTEAVQMVADGLGAPTDSVESNRELWVADTDLETAAGTVAAGTVAGQRYQWTISDRGHPVVRQETVWRMHESAAPQWPQGDWSLRITGKPTMSVSLPHRWNSHGLASTAAHAVNVVPYLLEAGSGVKTFIDLPLVAGRGAYRRP